jgi:TonB family protein
MTRSIVATAIFICLSALASAQSVEQVASSLEKHTAVLRNFYTDDNLTFDSDGKPISGHTSGFGPTDGRIYIDKVQVSGDTIILSGVRPVVFWNPESSEYRLTNVGRNVEVQVKLPNDPKPDAVAHLINQVFLKQSELHEIKCADTDIKLIPRKPGEPKPPDQTKLPSVQSLGEAPMLCFPGGERAYRVGRGILAPKATHTPDPHYPETARVEKRQGTVVLAVVVDTLGKPSTIIVTRPLGYGFDEKAIAAVASWTFQPAVFQGQPVPVGINVEVNFRLR